MPKQYDTSRNYYADLELPPTATCDDARKAYRKLVLKYHPDRNIGNEQEAVPKFQAVQAAHEILSDPEQKSKYDQDRSRAGLQGRGTVPRAQTYGNPYQASSAYPPPPRRTQPGQWQRPASAYTGADRFPGSPRPAPTAKQRPDPAQERTNMFRAWQNMNTASGQPPRPNPTPSSGATPTKPRPRPPPRKDGTSRMPNEEEIRAGMNYKAPPSTFERAEEKQTAWSAFQQANAGRAGMNRSKSTRTPKKAGFNPSAPGSDERAAPGSSNYARHRSEDYGTGSPFQTQPESAGSPPNASPVPPSKSHPQRPHPDPLHPYTSKDVPFQEGNRQRTPYQSFMNEKVDFKGDDLRRSFSQRDNASMNPGVTEDADRPRSTSPKSQSRHSSGAHRGFSSDGPRPPFVVYSSSENSSDLEPERSSSSSGSSLAGISKERSTDPNTDSATSRPPPAFGKPGDRPKKQPTPPSRRANGPFAVPDPPPSVFATDSSRQQSGSEEKPMQQKSNSHMYVTADPDSLKHPPFRPSDWAARMFGPSQYSTNVTDKQPRKLSIPKWAIPSSLSPEYEKSRKESILGESAAVGVEKNVSAGDTDTSQGARVRQLPSMQEMAGSDKYWDIATDEEKNAYFTTRQNLQMMFGSVAKDFDMEVFLRLASTVRLGNTSGNNALDHVLYRSLASYPHVGLRCVLHLNADNDHYSFSFPINNDTFRSSASRARSEENINTRFTDGEWNGQFTGQPGTFSPPPPPAGPTRKPQSPASRTQARQNYRAATSPFASGPPLGSAAPVFGATEMPPPPPPPPPPKTFNTDGASLEGTQSAPQGAGQGGFNQHAWAKQFKEPNWAMPPPPPPDASSRPGSGTQSRPGARVPPRRGFSADEAGTQQRQQPYTAHDGSQVVVEEEEPSNTSPPDQGDAMDIDDTPPAPQAPPPQNGASSIPQPPQSAAEDKGPRMVNVPPSPWRQQQSQANGSTQRRTSTSKGPATKLNTSLEDLGNVEPLARSAAEGLRNFQDLTASLPFQSQPSAALPTHPVEPSTLQMPPVPRAPAPPNKLSKASWHTYAAAFGKYLRAFCTFNATMLMHFQTRQVYAELQMAGSMDWLEATGDTVGGGSVGGFGKYMKEVREDEKARETWRIGCERHSEAVVEFDRVRERVRRSAIGGILPEV